MTYHLLIESEDRMGLVYSISGVLYDFGLNIEQNNEFVDKEHKRFFMRTEFSGTIDKDLLLRSIQEKLPDINIRLSTKRRKKVVIMVTREAHCLGDLLIRSRYGELDMEVAAVVSNHDSLRDLVESFGIPYHHVPHQNFSREDHEHRVIDVINDYAPEYLVLAKYMRILSPGFVKEFSNRIVNIHHSFLPAFIGASPYKQAYDRGVKIIGATAHFVNDELDDGPIITQSVIPVNHTYNAADMAQSGRDVEKQVLARALGLVFDDRVFIFGRKTIIFE